MQETITIDERFCGPPLSGNGGYTVGRLAAFFDFFAEVRLHYPPPLNVPLNIVRDEDSAAVQLTFGDKLVATARSKKLDMAPPKPPSVSAIKAVEANYIGFTHHNFPTCFVCGPEREKDDGLRIFPADIGRGECVAAIWNPSQNLANDRGYVDPVYLSAALDCPGFFAANTTKPALLGSMNIAIYKPLQAGKAVRVLGWCDHQEGRKIITGTALYDEDGDVIGASSQIWIILK